MKHGLMVSILLVQCSYATAQVVPDTISNARYYPVQVGNEWQYISYDFGSAIPAYERLSVSRDSVVDGRQYFELEQEYFDASFRLTNSRAHWLRYNAAGAVLSFSEVDADTLAEDESKTWWYHADFGDSLDTDFGRVFVDGTVDTAIVFEWPATIPIAALKTLYVPDPLQGLDYYVADRYAADIGQTETHVFDGPSRYLEYARIGGVVFGSPIVSVGIDDTRGDRRRPAALRLYPNPARGSVFVSVGDLNDVRRLSVFNVIGRRVIHELLPEEVAGADVEISLVNLSPGVYFVTLEKDRNVVATSALIVVE